MLKALVCRSCIDLDLHKEAGLFVMLTGMLLLLLLRVDWPKCISDIELVKRRRVSSSVSVAPWLSPNFGCVRWW